VRRCVWSRNLMNEEALARDRKQHHKKKKKLSDFWRTLKETTVVRQLSSCMHFVRWILVWNKRHLNDCLDITIFCLLKMWFHITDMTFVERWRINTLNDTANFSIYTKEIMFRDFNCSTLFLINKTGFTLRTNIKQRYMFPSPGHENVHGVQRYSSTHSKPQH